MSNPQQLLNKALSSKALKTTNTNANHKSILTNEKRKHDKSELSKQKPLNYKIPSKFEGVDVKGSATLNPNKTVIKNNQNVHQIKVNDYPTGQIKKKPFQSNLNINLNISNMNSINNINSINNLNHFKATQIKSQKQIKIQRQITLQSRSISGRRRRQQKRQAEKTSNWRKQFNQTPQGIDELNLLCDQQIQKQIPQHSNRSFIDPKAHYANKLQRTFKSELVNDRKQQRHSIIENKTQKKQNQYYPTIGMERTQSEHGTAIIKCKNINNYQGIHKNHPIVNYKQQLKKFSNQQNQINMRFQAQNFFYLQMSHKNYQVQPNYIQTKQKSLTWQMRAVLVDWMMHVCFQFGLKRDTFYLAVGIVDKYFQSMPNLQRADFQLAGAASMFIAAKLEQQNALPSSQFAKSTNNRYNQNQIKQMELKVCRALQFELNPPTLSMWSNRLMVQWDLYIQMTDAKFHPFFHNHMPKFFKEENDQAYTNYRMLMQYVDCAILDVQTQQYSPKILICSFMYLVLGKIYNEWSVKTIISKFPFTSTYLVAQTQYSIFNHLFHSFVMDSFNMQLQQLLPAIQYCATFFILPISNQAPQPREDQAQQYNLEQYQSYQTYNSKNLQAAKKRVRQI